MIGNKRVIGICVTKIHDTAKSRIINMLYEEAVKYGYKVMLFNSAFDITDEINNEIGVASVYDYINYDIIDAVIVFHSGISDELAYNHIISKALDANVPVILEDKIKEGCFTVRNTPDVALEKLINHVIRDHGVTDTFFMAGIRGNEFSNKRIEIYKKVLAENNLPFDESMVDYGGFWAGPTRIVMEKLLTRPKLPRAIICANDAMAIAVCDILRERGIKVPEEVIVTGFDGSPGADFSMPQLATCQVSGRSFCEKCIDIINKYFELEKFPEYNDNPYEFRPSASCGCCEVDNVDFKNMAKNYHHMYTDMNGHEYVIYSQILYQLNATGMDSNNFFGAMSRILDDRSYLSVRPFFLSIASGQTLHINNDNDKMFIISAKYENSFSGSVEFSASDMVPNLEEWENDDSMYVISALHVGKVIYGFYEVRTNRIIGDSQKINRVLSMVNMMIHMAVSDVRQRYLRINRGDNTTIDYVTELANREGITKWYKQYIRMPENKDRYLMVSVYQLPKYSFIYDNYGMDEVKKVVCYVAELLRIANPRDAFISHTAEDEFVVVNSYDDWKIGGEDIKRATNVFYSMLATYNSTNDKEFNVEVNAGCTVSPVKAKAKLETLIRLAIDELYKNREQYGTQKAIKDKGNSTKAQYELFNALISNNMFSYHFQPIVYADNGEIYAYEALMRTDASIGFSPLDVLSIAKDYQRLYDIEKATMFNVMERYKNSKDEFKGRKIFINCIPGNFLNDKDNEKLGKLYEDDISSFVFEITEQDTITDNELRQVRYVGNQEGNNLIAVDDYGTGHSNLVNLIKYAPQVVKIDRFLVTDIHKDTNKQMLVKGVIDFAKVNNIKILAEGVETKEELCKVINMGVDYIQGYYTGRPVAEPIAEIDPEIKELIINEHEKYLKENEGCLE